MVSDGETLHRRDPTQDLAVVTPWEGTFWRHVEEVIKHPDEADIALMRVTPMDREAGREDPAEPFRNYAGNEDTYAMGNDFIAFGYPEDIFGEDQGAITARLFKGSFQRFFPEYRSRHLGFRYLAGEMSIAAPGGLSGGPLFIPGEPELVTGMVTENLESTTYLDTVEEVRSGRETKTTRYQRVISYGVALMLGPVGEWLDQHVAPLQIGQGESPRSA